ncbi:NAD(P)-dependent dehydrogenase (short-subunit alcohol dehydrogenase family) [Kribbella voronezhensis]|uniref:NAD(P)-dependent dehydrogenase (Short-subunit alcohol dehydrogenase family) n=1 Tax=Kribbella voronezhensis TaxID=2512212 RepID=A0A4R7SWS9_9ACTN|nr:SDR family oxidoreductase [Kribbella voronezhensis]TDU83704.1 NAD(P)-dependent dehydrogenase (short-subunit alcohol dehydrogenase family) [Kribbella voronezhensis]
MSERSVCIVTGGGGVRIGNGICRVLAAKGWTVVVADQDLPAAVAVAEEVRGAGADAVPMALDTTDAGSVRDVVAATVREFGRIDALVNSAGVGLRKHGADATPEEFDRVHAINYRGPWTCIREVLPVMLAGGGGSIVNIGSVHAAGAAETFTLYAATKAALAALTRGIARDYGLRNIRCNIVHPGAVESRGNEHLLADFVATKQMLPTAIESDDIGNAVAFLLSTEARAITGTELFVDAGTTAMLFEQ